MSFFAFIVLGLVHFAFLLVGLGVVRPRDRLAGVVLAAAAGLGFTAAAVAVVGPLLLFALGVVWRVMELHYAGAVLFLVGPLLVTTPMFVELVMVGRLMWRVREG